VMVSRIWSCAVVVVMFWFLFECVNQSGALVVSAKA
jgi:hypothetical protein